MNKDWNLVPKTSLANKKVVWRDVTWVDIAYALGSTLIYASIIWPLPINFFIRLTCFVCLLAFVLVTLIKKRKTGLRIYQSIFLFIKFSVLKKKYSSKEVSEKYLMFEGIEDSYIKVKTKNSYMGAFKVHGIDLGNNDVETQEMQILNFNDLILRNEDDFTLIAIKETHNWNKNIENIKRKVKELKADGFINNEYNCQLYKSRLNQLENCLRWFEEQKENKEFLATAWYVVFNGTQVADIQDTERRLLNSFGRVFYCEKLDPYECCNLTRHLWNPLADEISKEDIDDGKFTILPEGEVKFYSDAFSINDNYYSVGTLSLDEMPLNANPYWLYRLSMTDATMVVNVHPIQKQMANRIIQKTLNNSMYVASQYDENKNAVDKQNYYYQNDVMNRIKDNVASGTEKLNSVGVYWITYGGSVLDRSDATELLNNIIKDENMGYNPLKFLQKEYFSSILPIGAHHQQWNDLILPALTFASSFPIQNSVQIDNSGVILGVNNNSNPVVLDVNLRNRQRINSNALIIGNTGSGKTTTVKKILSNHIANNGIAFILDPEQDYVHLTQYYEGKIIDASNGNSSKINPLQVLLNEAEEDDGVSSSQNLISNHISLILSWFKLLELPLNAIQVNRLKDLIIDLYRTWGLFDKNLYLLKPTDYPTFSDFARFLANRLQELKLQKIGKQNKHKDVYTASKTMYDVNLGDDILVIYEVIYNTFCNGGIYDNLYNGHSLLNIGDNDVVDFDVKNLLANSASNRKSAQMLLIIAYIQNAINLNGYASEHPKHALLVVDEAHLFIDTKYPDVLIFLSQMSKRIRKRNGGVWITTQNPSDFIAGDEIIRYTKALVENTQYTFVHSLRPNDANAIVEMYRNSPNPITSSEKDFIQQDKKGQCLLIVSNKQRQCLEVMVSEEEFKAIGHDPRDKFDLSKIDMSINWEAFDDEVLNDW